MCSFALFLVIDQGFQFRRLLSEPFCKFTTSRHDISESVNNENKIIKYE